MRFDTSAFLDPNGKFPDTDLVLRTSLGCDNSSNLDLVILVGILPLIGCLVDLSFCFSLSILPILGQDTNVMQ